MANEKRLIDANEVLRRIEEEHKKAQKNPVENFVSLVQCYTVKEMVNSSPTVDAVEVVRCKDCKRMNEEKLCVAWEGFVREDDFCSYGEKRGDWNA